MNAEETFISNIASSKKPKLVKIDDTIKVGCGHCGSCCMHTSLRLSAFDIYRIATKVGEKEALKHTTFYFGENTHLPIIGLFTSKESGMCPYLTDNNNGDYICTLEDVKPSTCIHPFVAVGMEFKKSEFDFVPFDQEVKKFDIDEYLKDHDISNNRLYYLEDRNANCPSKSKKEMLVSEYLSDRMKYDVENNLAVIVSMLLSKYIEVHKFTQLLYLSEHSSINDKDIQGLFKLIDAGSYQKIVKTLFIDSYLYTDVHSSKSFIEQTIEHIHHLENFKYPILRVLYRYFYKVFDPSFVILDGILETEDDDLAQERFDNYFSAHIKEINQRFHESMEPMFHEIKGIEKEEKEKE